MLQYKKTNANTPWRIFNKQVRFISNNMRQQQIRQQERQNSNSRSPLRESIQITPQKSSAKEGLS